MPVDRKRFRTALPKEPVPPIIRRVLFLNTDHCLFQSIAPIIECISINDVCRGYNTQA